MKDILIKQYGYIINAIKDKFIQKGTISKSDVGLANVSNDKQIKGITNSTENDVVVFGADGYSVKDSGFSIAKSVPSNAEFTDTWYQMEGATATTDGKEGYIPKPVKGNQNKFLKGDGTWGTVAQYTSSSKTITFN